MKKEESIEVARKCIRLQFEEDLKFYAARYLFTRNYK